MEVKRLTKDHRVMSKVISQKSLTSDCWLVQFWGLKACERCEYKGSPDCGGKRILSLIEKGKFSQSGLPDIGSPRRVI